MNRPVRCGVALPQIKRSWQHPSAAAREFDSLDFDSLWVCDPVYRVPIATLPILESWTLLSAIDALTQRAKLGTLVTPPCFRNPARLAKQIATLDPSSNGRAIAGLGAPEKDRRAPSAMRGTWRQSLPHRILRPRYARGHRAELTHRARDPILLQ